ncbi:MAG: hypothetical protein J5736_05895 [Bacilli bacterium]|nr:hypothetical protein [Bacilli bacterium]
MQANRMKLFALIGALSMGAALSACQNKMPTPESQSSEPSSQVPSSSVEPSGDPSTSTPDSQPASGAVKVVFWHTFGQKVVSVLERYISQFETLVKQNEGIDVDVELAYQGGYSDMVSKVSLGWQSAASPTIAVAYPDHVAEYLYMEDQENKPGKYVVNMQDFIDSPTLGFGTDRYLGDTLDEDDFVEAFYNEGTQFAREGYYVLPYMKSSEIMLYNLDKVTAAYRLQQNDPSISQERVRAYMNTISWDQLMELATFAYQNKAQISNAIDYPVFYDSDANLFISKMYQNEISYASLDAQGKPHLDFETGEARTKAEALVNSFKTLHDDHIFTTKGCEGEYASTAFKEESCLICIGSSGGAGYSFPAAGSFTAAVAKVPESNNNPLYISQGPSLTLLNRPELTSSENQLAVKYGWKFLKYITSTKVNIALCVSGSEGYVPVRGSCYTTEEYAEFLEEGELYAATAEVLNNDISGNYLLSPTFKGSATLRDQFGAVVGSVLKGKIETSAGFDTAFNEVKKVIAK